MLKTLLSYSLITILIISCEKQDESPKQTAEYILFGHFYGFCHGEQCVEIYKLTDSNLFEDELDQYPSRENPYDGKFNKLENSKYQLVKSLAENIPSELLLEKDTVIGMPDASDGGGVYFAIINDAETRFWLVDQFDHNIPEFLRPFKEQINNSISMIND